MGRPKVHDDALAARLLEVASASIARSGTEGLTVRAVAARAGTSSSAVYALFGSRDALVHAVGEEAFRRFARRLGDVGGTNDAGADLLALGLAYRAGALAEPHFYRVMFATAGAGAQEADAVAATDRPTFAVLRDAVVRVLPGGVPPAAAQECALVLWGLVHGLVSLELAGLLPGDTGDRGRRYETALRAAGPALLTALAPEPAGAPLDTAGQRSVTSFANGVTKREGERRAGAG